MIGIYNTVLFPLRAGAFVWSAWRGRDARARDEWDQRLARRLPDARPGGVWFHGASVGEARLVDSLVRALHAVDPARPLAASTVTRTGCEQLPQPPVVDAAFIAPLDFAGLPRRVLRTLRPAALALVETELWPNLLREAEMEGVPTVVLNARLSPRRMQRYRRLRSLYRPRLARLARVAAQTQRDADGFIELGVPRDAVEVTGNIKYDLPPPDVDVAALRARVGLVGGGPVLVAGSTGDGEDAPVLDAFLRLRRRHPGLRLVLAPRHPARAAAVERLIADRGLNARRLSLGSAEPVDVLLVDTLGQLGSLYALATLAFVGGSLVPVGGHNLLEPASFGVPVLFGPHTDHVAEPAARLEHEGGGIRVADGPALAQQAERLLGDTAARERCGALALHVVESNRGALQRCIELLREVLARRSTPSKGAA